MPAAAGAPSQKVAISLRKSWDSLAPAPPGVLSPTKAQYITLEQEFQMCEKIKKPGISFEKVLGTGSSEDR